MKTYQKIITLLLLLALPTFIFSQEAPVQSNDLMRSNGRIYVVVAVVLTILIGLILYVARLDKKITNLEKDK